MPWQILAGRLGSWSTVMVSWSTAIEKEQMETMKRFSKTRTFLLVAAWIKVPMEGSKWPLFPLLKGLCLHGLSLVFTVTSGDRVSCLNVLPLYFVNSYTYRSTKQANNQNRAWLCYPLVWNCVPLDSTTQWFAIECLQLKIWNPHLRVKPTCTVETVPQKANPSELLCEQRNSETPITGSIDLTTLHEYYY